MNIFFLHPVPAICAQQHCDKHVVKMILEYTQLLCTAHHEQDGNMMLTPPLDHSQLLAPTHKNHPCAIWVRDCMENYSWLAELLFWLHEEYTLRYGKKHKLLGLSQELLAHPNCQNSKSLDGITHPALAMPKAVVVLADALIAKYKILNSSCFQDACYPTKSLCDIPTDYPTSLARAAYCYRCYYATHKADLLTYTGRPAPKWAQTVAVEKASKAAK